MKLVRIVALLGLFAACDRDQARTLRPSPGPRTGAVRIHRPERLAGVLTGDVDALGRPVRAPCVTCHTLRTPAALPTAMDQLHDFHQGLTFAHGALTCASCHVAGDQRALHAADGTRVDLRDAIMLCRQCHGPQARDYDHGSHGGMNGAWDLSAGDRLRNHCIDCHDPHAPAFLPSRPVLPPQDRGLTRHPREPRAPHEEEH